jgi:hypothetical protein
MKILFKLREVDAIIPWGKGADRSLSWFGLTDGIYCINTPAGRLFEYSLPADPNVGEPWCDYQVARLFEDLIEIWPVVADPVPEDILARYLAWRPREVELMRASDDEKFLEACAEARVWWNERCLDTLYLRSQPALFLWRAGDEVRLSWQALEPWTVASAELSFSFESVQAAVAEFFNEFLTAMRERVHLIERDGWRREDCRVDVVQLVAGQPERESWVENAMSRVRTTDWNVVRARLTEIGA